ncbi:hypothetical protein TUMSATVNIG1_54710 [Vibrio nigripulchritudo]|uniref:hypothetical protein n=1 Tax=Vibrio nigripulchritudo TaxID=28173 RepID=UPI001C7858EB|nr:hypothetical protein [Vibrio nigripulchritudo]BCL73495.1 hypothetical protein VNTUMSATTG_54320 [Vibrio nigripulchritudo]BDU34862.1 hypothetical protein TUMSATVNIG1_54710 [Vibrio nigripulchritudo]
MNYLSTATILLLTSISLNANASSSVAGNVTKVGCHINSNMCFAYVDVPINTSCIHNDGSLRWDGVATINSDKVYSTLLAAQSSGKKVVFGGAGIDCYQGFPSFKWVLIE